MSARPACDLGPAFAHAQAELPRECCGLIVRQGGVEQYVPCRNLAAFKHHFVLDPVDYARAEDDGEVVAIVHSHVAGGVEPSQADRLCCDRSGLPWLIVSALGHALWLDPDPARPMAPLLGRQYAFGVFDCLSLVRDYYRLELGIEVPDFPRGPRDWAKRGRNDLVENLEAAGFRRVPREDPRRHDVLLLQIGADVPSHLAVFTGDGRILHQLENRLSDRAVYGGYWERVHVMTARHRSLFSSPLPAGEGQGEGIS